MESLFDDLEDDESPESSEWNEVPQAVFLSWSHERQNIYCAMRDEDAACYTETVEETEWYLKRAKLYRRK